MTTSLAPSAVVVRRTADVSRFASRGRRARREPDVPVVLLAIGWFLALGITLAALAAVTPPGQSFSSNASAKVEAPAGTLPCHGERGYRRSLATHDCVSPD